ncbi:Ppx/GppA family phosphatase [bacterium]|jgi:exopolyphosphatase/guanosine-5'-triphosphate,3'-diphosphate pyrophosphatase|nr:Ppx/GppA family phosphatase [bacterium]MBT4291969.1 Ppx/GppA family phosphatase [bacterium]MBT7310267.1 Ppx/GppA family phosphatase [bacterium]
MSRYAVIDIGTNSMKMHVARVMHGRMTVLGDYTEITRLGEGFHETKILTDDAIDRNVAQVEEFRIQAEELGVEKIVAVGTMALRSAKNSDEFLEAVKKKSKMRIEIIPGEEEARLSYLAVLSGLGAQDGKLVIFDTGGGSTEFIFGKGEEIDRQFSLDIGSRRPTEEYCKTDPVTNEELESMFEGLEKEFEDISGPVDVLVGMGGTVTSLGAVFHEMKIYDPEVIQGSTLPIKEVERQVKMYRARTIDKRADTIGLMPKRADVILAGASIVLTIMRKLGTEELIISDRGLRHGLMFDRFGRSHV